MFERFTPDARQVVVLAQEEARALRHDHVGTEHLLLALLRLDTPTAAALRRHGLQHDAVAQSVAAHLGGGDLDDGRTEVVTLSFWTSLDAVRAFAGDDVSAAVFYPEDDRFLVDRERTVTHHEVH